MKEQEPAPGGVWAPLARRQMLLDASPATPSPFSLGVSCPVWRRLPSRHTCPRGVGAAGQLTHCNCHPLSGGRRTGGLSRQDRGRAQRLRKKKLRWRDQTSHPEASPLSSVHSLLYGEVSGRNIYLCPWHPGTPLSLTPQVYSFRRSKFR